MSVAPSVLLAAALLPPPAAPPPPDCVARDTALLQSLVGDWEVEMEFRTGDEWERAPGRASVRPELSGCVLVERYTGTRQGAPYEFLALLGANGMGDPIQEVFVHSQHGILSLSSGKVTGGGLVVEDAPIVDGKVVRLRHTYSDVTAEGFRYESSRSTDGGASWRVTVRGKYRRASAPR